MPHKPKSVTASEARARAKSAKSGKSGTSRPKSAAAGGISGSGSRSAKVVKAPSRTVKPVDALLKEMHSDGTMYVPKFYRGDAP